MPSERIQRRIDALLDEAEAAMSAGDWSAVAEKARAVLAMDPDNEDAPRAAPGRRGQPRLYHTLDAGAYCPHPYPYDSRPCGTPRVVRCRPVPRASLPR